MKNIPVFGLLVRIDLARNMRRFYRIDIQPNLFGSCSLLRTWGRIGTRGRMAIEFFDNQEEACQAGELKRDGKLKRGYVEAL